MSIANTSLPHGLPPPKPHIPSTRRKQLHILYLLNDLLHHSKFHGNTTMAFSTLSEIFEPSILELVGATVAYDSDTYPKHFHKIERLLANWEEQTYFSPEYIQKLRRTVADASKNGSASVKQGLRRAVYDLEFKVGNASQVQKYVPFIMPALHGDPSTPYYDLPAGNMMSHIIPNSAAPINSQLVKPLHLIPGPADESLALVVKDFLNDVDVLYGNIDADEELAPVDADELGQPVVRDQITGEIIGGEGYYGWSKAFCERMKCRRDGANKSTERHGRTNSPSAWRRYSSSQSGRSRRGSSSLSRSKSQSRSWSRNRDMVDRRSSSIDRIPSEGRASGQISKGLRQRRMPSRSRSPFENRSHTQRGRYESRRSRSPSRSRSRTYSPPQRILPAPQTQPTHHSDLRSEQRQQVPPAPSQPFARSFPQDLMPGPVEFPIHPPPPPGYLGAWPPLPPPLGPNLSFIPAGTAFNGFSGFVPPHPFPTFGDQESGIPQGPRHGHNGLDSEGWAKPFNQTGSGTMNQYHGPSQPYPQYGIHGRGGGKRWR